MRMIAEGGVGRTWSGATLLSLGAMLAIVGCDDGGTDDPKAADVAVGYDIHYTDAGAFLPPKPSTAICQPCNSSIQCDGADDAGAHCVDFGAAGSFCGRPCEPACTQGYACKDVKSSEGVSVKQCVPATGECACSAWAAAKSMSTQCLATSTFEGKSVSCPGNRVCSAAGLSACDAPAPKAETCDGIDNDCDGQTDEETCTDTKLCQKGACHKATGCTYEPAPGNCNDGDACTQNDGCINGGCAGSKIDCDDGKPCTKDSCDKAKGCVNAPLSGLPCDDGVPCTKGDVCAAGACKAGTAVDCNDGNACTIDLCQKTSGACINSATTDACDDANPCTTGDACKDGACTSGAAKVCDDGLACTKDSCDPKAGCVSLPAGVTTCD